MNKMKYLLILMCLFLSTGCIKMNANMKINKDKSMDYEIIMAMNKDLISDENSVLNDDQLKKIKKNGYTVKDYEDDEMKGYTITRHVKNIDEISTTKKISSSLDAYSDEKYLFTVKKGFFKNTYKAKLVSDSTDNISNGMIDDESENEIESDDNENDEWYEDDELDYEDDSEDNEIDISTDDTDYSSYSKNMSFEFNLELPSKSKSNNATKVNKSGKKLTWNLLELEDENIEFEFELYNMTNIYLTIGLCIVIIIAAIIIFMKKKKNA